MLLEVTEDTPPDMLTGSMDLRLVLPDQTRVRMSVHRRTPMMDLLVQATTAYKISPGGYVLQPYGETGLLPYKPSTPIGALDTWIVHIVPKSQALQNPASKINLKQVIPPFEQTTRFQVKLPRNQLYVSRLSGRTTLRQVLLQACSEKCLDPTKYTLRHPKDLDKQLCDEMSIAEYGDNQVIMMSLRDLPTAVSTEDILLMNRVRAQKNGGGGGGSGTAGGGSGAGSIGTEGSDSSAGSSISPVPRAEVLRPALRKRKPPPPPPMQPPPNHQNEAVICHSRTSSDSSGYHESSVLSESPESNNRLGDRERKGGDAPLSRSLSNLHQASTSGSSKLKPAQSTSSLVFGGRKKKRAPPPPPPLAITEEREEKSATLPAGVKLLESSSTLSSRERELENGRLEAEIEEMFEAATREHVSLESGLELSREPSPDWNWEYRLPAPPTFRDEVTSAVLSPPSPSTDSALTIEGEAPLLHRHGSVSPLTIGSQRNSDIVYPDENVIKMAKVDVYTDDGLSPVDNNNIYNGISNGFVHTGNTISNGFPETLIKDNGFSENSIKENCFSENKTKENIFSENKPEIIKATATKKIEKIYITPDLQPSLNINGIEKTKVNFVNNNFNSDNKVIIEPVPNNESQSKVVCISISSDEKNVCIINDENKRNEAVSSVDGREKLTEYIKIKEKTAAFREDNRSKPQMAVDTKPQKVVDVQPQKVVEAKRQSAVLSELTSVINERGWKPKQQQQTSEQQQRQPPSGLKNFILTTYSGSKPLEIYKDSPQPSRDLEQHQPREASSEQPPRAAAAIMRSRSTVEENRWSMPVKRSTSVVGRLLQKSNFSRSTVNLVEIDSSPLNSFKTNLRKTSSELSINIDSEDQKENFSEEGSSLQSLQVLRSILPQLSQSQGSLNTLARLSDRSGGGGGGEKKPAVSLSSWTERPKRQVSIKRDGDYVTNEGKLESQASVTEEMVAATPPSPPPQPLLVTTRQLGMAQDTPADGSQLTPRQQALARSSSTSVYKSLETGNTRPIKLSQSDLGRIPVVTAVELKKNTALPSDGSTSSAGPRSRAESRQIKPPSYLFGCEPKVPTPPPAPPAMLSPVRLKPAAPRSDQSRKPLPVQPKDPREELLASIRSFGGKSSLRKVSAR